MARALIVVEERLGPLRGSSWAPLGAPLACIANRPLIGHVIQSLREAGADGVVMVADHASAAALRHALAGEDQGLADVDWVELDSPVGALEAIGAAAAVLAGECFLLHRPDELHTGDRESLREALAEGTPALLELRGHDCGSDHAGIEALADVWRYRGSAQDLLDVNHLILDGLDAPVRETQGVDCRLEGRVQLDPTALVRGSVIRGPVVVGPGARIVDAYVGPYSAIGPGVVVENAEVESSMLLEGSSVTNVGVRIESSIVGRGAEVTRDFKLPRGIRLLLGDQARVTLT